MSAKKKDKAEYMATYPVVPLRNALMVPHIITPILVGRSASLEAVDYAFTTDRMLVCLSQKSNIDSDDDPKASELYRVGTICSVHQVFRMPDGNIRALIEGKMRVRVHRFVRKKHMLNAQISFYPLEADEFDQETLALIRSFRKSFLEYVQHSRSIPEESLAPFHQIQKPEEFFYFVLANYDSSIDFKQRIFELPEFNAALIHLYEHLNEEIEILKLERKIDGKVKDKLSRMQREYYLNEQLKVIHKELGITQEEQEDLIDFRKRVEETPLNEEARKRAQEELKKLSRLSHHSQEYGVVYNYLSWILDIPWGEPDNTPIDLKLAQTILDEDHYGLKKIKERILEYLAVLKLSGGFRGQILCFVGPPGVGKTSLGKSIARAVGREFVRLSLGGVRDEAEIRGHRRTYIGALPGVIMQSMKKAGTVNPLIMMDEIDKMSMDFRGDPAAALLEVLDSEQNNQFRDHYFDFGYDLSNVFFITTANKTDTIPSPLLDRMEILRLPGYTQMEKIHIAEKHLIPKQCREHKLKGVFELDFPRKVIQQLIDSYTREAGVRELERKIAAVIRKIIRRHLETPLEEKITLNRSQVEDLLGVPKFLYPEIDDQDRIGVVNGLAWTASGGEILLLEVLPVKGEGKIHLTGQLGDVMQESAQAAYSYIRYNAAELGIDEDFYKKFDLHLHIPEGAIPKDGPSAGVTILTAMVSALSGVSVDHTLAMTGEITLTGKVLPIGGLPEKLIAAKRAKILRVIVPEKNRPNVSELKEEITEGLEILFVSDVHTVLKTALKK